MKRGVASPRVLDLFCGIGGLSLGLKQAGFEILGGADKWDLAVNTYNYNNDSTAVPFDINVESPSDLLTELSIQSGDVDVIAGGPPCQGFSTVGKRDPSDKRNQLWRSYFEFVKQISPAYIIIENVEGLAVMRNGKIRGNIEMAFMSVGYKIKSRILTSADYGVPQLRKRLIFIGWKFGLTEPNWPETINPASYVSVDAAIGDLPPLLSGEIKREYELKPYTKYQSCLRANSTVLHNHQAANHPERLVHVISHIPDGGNRKSIPDHLQPRSGFHNSYARLASWKPAIAVTSNMRKPSSARAIHPFQNRGLTVREGLRLQTFPDSFKVLGSRTSQYLQVGNAVPPLLAKAIGQCVADAFFTSEATTISMARESSDAVPEYSELQYSLFV